MKGAKAEEAQKEVENWLRKINPSFARMVASP
jgi:hypothetical protein